MAALYGSPTLAASGDGRLELFVFDIDMVLWHIWQTAWSNGWSGWNQSGSAWADPTWPASAHPSGDGRLELFVAADNLYHSWQTAWSNGWSAWASSPPPPPAAGDFGFYVPSVAAGADGRLAAFTANGALWRLQQDSWSDGWSDWQAHGSPDGALLVGPVSAVTSADGRIEVFVVDVDGQLWNIRQASANDSYSGWNFFGSPPGAALADRPALARNADGRLNLFMRGTDGALYQQWETAVGTMNWSGWVSMGEPSPGGLVDHPAVAPSADRRLELFITGADGTVWHSWQTEASNGWAAWVAAEPPVGANQWAPEVRPSGDGRLELFVVGRDGSLWHSWQTAASNGWSDWDSAGHP